MGETHVKLHREADSVGVLMKVQKILPGRRDREPMSSPGSRPASRVELTIQGLKVWSGEGQEEVKSI